MADKKPESDDFEIDLKDAGSVKDDEELAMQRFVTREETSEVILRPQCVGCVHNGGIMNCDAFGKKPQEYISNTGRCPKRKA